MPQRIDCYRVLQLDPSATPAQVTAAYRRLCKLYHPDVSTLPGSETVMRTLNAAYHILRDAARRQAYDRERSAEPAPQAPRRPAEPRANPRPDPTPRPAPSPPPPDPGPAEPVMQAYLACLLAGDYDRAWELLCLYDRQYASRQSFIGWRRSVRRLFAMRSFEIAHSAAVPRFELGGGAVAPARRIEVWVVEQNLATGAEERYLLVKHAVLEYGRWRIFLGHRDLNAIAEAFNDLSRRREEREMALRWEAYRRSTWPGLDMLSREGLLGAAERELYRCRRYDQTLALALFDIRPPGPPPAEDALAERAELCARALQAALRLTDIPAYLGGGVFAVLLISPRRRALDALLARLAGRMAQAVRPLGGPEATPRFAFTLCDGGPLPPLLERLGRQLGL